MSKNKQLIPLNGMIVAAGLNFTLTNPQDEKTIAYCYKNPDVHCSPEQEGGVGFGFNLADGAGFLPLWDLLEDTRVTMSFGQALEAIQKGFTAADGINNPVSLLSGDPEASVGGAEPRIVMHFPEGRKITWQPSQKDLFSNGWHLVMENADE